MSRGLRLEDIASGLPAAAEVLRRQGHSIGTSELVDIITLARSYADLEGRDFLGEDELAMVVEAVVKSKRLSEAVVEELRRASSSSRFRERVERLESEIMASLQAMGLSPGGGYPRRGFRGGGGRL